jgi:ADP-ribosylglycohydrolase
MRSPILGVALGGSNETLEEFVRASTEITHSDPKAFFGAMAAAVVAYQRQPYPQCQQQDFWMNCPHV